MLLLALVPGRAMPKALRRRCEPWAARTTARAFWLTGACIAAQRSVLDALGPFDPAIHLYSEDLDLGLRASGAGVPSYVVPDVARVVHSGDASSSQAFADAGRQLSVDNRVRVIASRAGRARAAADVLLQAAAHANRLVLKRMLRRPAAAEVAALRSLARAARATRNRTAPR